MDLHSRRIIAQNFPEVLRYPTVNKAKHHRQLPYPLIIHTDRGSQYVASEYLKATENIERYYLKTAYPWDNTCIESFLALI